MPVSLFEIRVMHRLKSPGLVLLVLLAGSGCGPSSSLEYAKLCPAQGTLTINGQPAEGAMLIFVSQGANPGIDERGTRPHAYVGADGVYHVTSYVEGDGIPVGDYNVGILWEDHPNSDSAWDRLAGRYSNWNKTGLSVTVTEGENQFSPIELDKVRIVERPANFKATSDDE